MMVSRGSFCPSLRSFSPLSEDAEGFGVTITESGSVSVSESGYVVISLGSEVMFVIWAFVYHFNTFLFLLSLSQKHKSSCETTLPLLDLKI